MICEHVRELYTLNYFSGSKNGTISYQGITYFPSIIISVLWLNMRYCVLYCNLISLRELYNDWYWKYIEKLMNRLIFVFSHDVNFREKFGLFEMFLIIWPW